MATCQRCQQFPACTTAMQLPVCQACSNVLQAPPLPQVLNNPIQCNCTTPIYNSDLVCRTCGFVQWGLVEELRVVQTLTPTQTGGGVTPGLGTSQPASPYWTCPTCKYEYNLSQTCGKCGAKQQVPNMSAMPQASSVSSPNPCWVCPQCRYEYNMQNSCGRCQYQRAPAVAAPNPVAPTGLQTGTNLCWTCPSCNYGYNVAQTCTKCGLQLQAGTQTASPYPPLATTWNCTKCGHANSRVDQNCQNCARLPGYSLPNAYPMMPQCSTCGVDCGGRCTSQRAQVSNSAPFTPVNVQPPLNTTPITHNPAQGYNFQPAPMTLTRYRKCRYCGDAFQGAQLCSQCRYPDEGDTWKCFGCGNLHPAANEVCDSCNASKYLGLYLISRGKVTLTEDRRQWVCKCEAKTQIYVPKCSDCGKESQKVQKALEFDGNSLSMGERFGKVFGL